MKINLTRILLHKKYFEDLHGTTDASYLFQPNTGTSIEDSYSFEIETEDKVKRVLGI